MALYHFSVKQVSRGKGQTVVNSAAYISGQKLYNDYYGQVHDYTRKSGVMFTEILKPDYVPERLSDRETLWNEVERAEKGKRAQLAYSFDIALQNELTLEENIQLAREFCQEQFVARGMIVDLAVHEGKSKDGDEPDNPHFHVLAPIRPFTEEGIWGNKQKREYVLDEEGNRIKDAKGKYVFNAVSTTGWNDPELLKEWRKAWTEKVNDKFRECHMAARIDHRSYKEQGIDAMLREFTRNTPKYAAALANPIGGIVAASTLLLGTFVAKNIEKGEAIKNSTVDSEEIKKILKENLVTVNANIKNKKKAIAQLEQEIVDEETKVKSLEYLLKNIENVKGDANE